MYKIYIERSSDCDYVYRRDTYTEARQLASSQRKDYVLSVTIADQETSEIVYQKVLNNSKTRWIIEIDKFKKN